MSENKELKTYSENEVAEHNNKNSLWIIIGRYIYDVTEFVTEHPGGEDKLLDQAGLESTYEFEDVGHSLDARELMKKYRIGRLAEMQTSKSSGGNLANNPDGFLWNAIPIALGLIAAFIYYTYFR